ncbi:6-cysteine protein [Plasmodium vivax]|uniref:6-cysteine protein n=1 Tax=Plasmodium vivax TaxID=5855 RepID=A0A564ZYI2_PLAVI|nr:6-cysteine protein [Plasmodium vivax]
MRVGHFSFVRLLLLQSLLVQRLPVQKQQQSSIPARKHPEEEGGGPSPQNALAQVANQMKGTCDFSRAPLNVSCSENEIVALPGGEGAMVSGTTGSTANDERARHCVQFTKGFDVLTFVCPKRSSEDYSGVEIRPMSCFETVRRTDGTNQQLSEVLKGVQLENRDTDLLSIRRVFIPPTIYQNFIFECSCDNSLTFWKNKMGARGIMRVHLRRNILFGCDFDHTGGVEYTGGLGGELPMADEASAGSAYDRSAGGGSAEDRSAGGGSADDWAFWRNAGPSAEELAEKNKTAFTNFYPPGEVSLAKEKGLVCDVKITKREVYLGLVCPPGYEMYPSNCFERVLQKDGSIVRVSELLKHDVSFHADGNRRMSFATFTLNRNENPQGFSCMCLNVQAPEAPPLQANFAFHNYESAGVRFGLPCALVALVLLALCL